MSFIRRIPDATADMLLGNGEEQITWLGGKMQKHWDIQMRPNTHEPENLSISFSSQITTGVIICKYDACKLRTCHFKSSSLLVCYNTMYKIYQWQLLLKGLIPPLLLCVANTCWNIKCKSTKPHNKMQIASRVSNTAQQDDERADGVSVSLCAVAGKFHWPSYFIRHELGEELCWTTAAKKPQHRHQWKLKTPASSFYW